MSEKSTQVSLKNVSIRLKQNWLADLARGDFFPKPMAKDIFLIKSANFSIPEGSLFAILGGSGSGKTTLLNVIAGRYDKMSYDVQGRIKFGTPQCSIGYVTQNDYLLPHLTVRETVLFTAKLKVNQNAIQPKSLDQLVVEVLLDLGLKECMDSRVGDMNMTGGRRGISGGEKRRVSVALQVISGPQVLCADEPTSGLDSFTAITVMESLKRLTYTRNTTVICSVHQPRADIFNIFDYALILSKGGHTLFCGPTAELVPYFAHLGYDCPVHANPADFFVDLVSVDNSTIDRKHECLARIDFLITSYQASIRGKPTEKITDDDLPLASLKIPVNETSWWYQVQVLMGRFFINEMRDTSNITGGIAQSVILSLVCMAIFWQLPNDSAGISSRVGLLYIDVSMENYMLMVILIERYCRELKILDRELQDELYQPSAYYIAHIVSNLPLLLVITLCFSAPLYFGSNMRSGAEYFLIYALTNFAMIMVINGLVWMSVAIDRRFSVASLVGNVSFTFVSLSAGFLVNYDSIPIYVRWVKDISFLSYGYRILMDNEFNDRTYHLCTTEVIKGKTIQICSDVPGSTILSQYSVATDAYQTSWPILIAIGLVYFIIAGGLLHYVRFPPTGSVASDLTLQQVTDDDEEGDMDDMMSRYSDDETAASRRSQPPAAAGIVVSPLASATTITTTTAAAPAAATATAPAANRAPVEGSVTNERPSFEIEAHHNPIDISSNQVRTSLKQTLLPTSTVRRNQPRRGDKGAAEDDDEALDGEEGEDLDDDEGDGDGVDDVEEAKQGPEGLLEGPDSFHLKHQPKSFTSTEIRLLGGVVINVFKVDLFVKRPSDLSSWLTSEGSTTMTMSSSSASTRTASNGPAVSRTTTNASSSAVVDTSTSGIRESDLSSMDPIRPSEASMVTAVPSPMHRGPSAAGGYKASASATAGANNNNNNNSSSNTATNQSTTVAIAGTTAARGDRQYKQILNDVSVEIRPGKLVAIMGGSGSGKTTLLNLIANRIPQAALVPHPHPQYPHRAFMTTTTATTTTSDTTTLNQPTAYHTDDNNSLDPHYRAKQHPVAAAGAGGGGAGAGAGAASSFAPSGLSPEMGEPNDVMYKGRGGIYFNGRVPSQRDVRRLIGYVQQFDFHLPSLTVVETLMYQAKLRLKPPSKGSGTARTRPIQVIEVQRFYRRRVERVMKILGLRAVRHIRVGDDESKGISGGEKRRLSIGIQLLSNPAICLLDEPTTGLDAFTARKIVLTLKDLVQGRLTGLYQSNASRDTSQQDATALYAAQQDPFAATTAGLRATEVTTTTQYPSFTSSATPGSGGIGGGGGRETSLFGGLTTTTTSSTAAMDRKTVILSIHQPRYDIFAAIDEIILLSRGHVVWAGNSQQMLRHFESLGYPCPTLVNPADFILDLSSIDFRTNESERECRERLDLLVQAFRAVHDEEQAFRPFVPPLPPSSSASVGGGPSTTPSQQQQRKASTNTWHTRVSSITMTSALLSSRSSLWSQSNQSHSTYPGGFGSSSSSAHLFTHRKGFFTTYLILLHRATVNLSRQPALLFNRVTQCLFYALILACFYSPLGDDQVSIQNRIGLLYELTPLCFIGMLNCIAIFPTERGIFYREYVDGYYPAYAFLAAYFTIALPIVLLGAACIGVLTTCATGLAPELVSAMKFTWVIFLFIATGESIGVAFCMAFDEIGFAVNIMSALFSVFSITAGFISLNMPQFLIDLSYVSPLRWGAYLLANIAFAGETFVCDGNDDHTTGPNPATCALTTGDEVLALYGFTGGGSMAFHYLMVTIIAVIYFVLCWIVFRWRAYKLSH